MAPTKGSIHRRPRSDSGAARIWDWARGKRGPWTSADAAEACEISPRRCRAIVAAMHDAGLLDCERESELAQGSVGMGGQQAAEWSLSVAGRALAAPPVLIVDRETGAITGIRAAANGDGTAKLRRHVERSGLTGRAAARALGVNDRTLRRMLAGKPAIAGDDPILARAARL